jgi:hypothetical protein
LLYNYHYETELWLMLDFLWNWILNSSIYFSAYHHMFIKGFMLLSKILKP